MTSNDPNALRPGDAAHKTQLSLAASAATEKSALDSIPNVMDRLIQQAILQVLTPIFDPSFSESSFGFRRVRSAYGATQQIQRTIRDGYRWCVDGSGRVSRLMHTHSLTAAKAFGVFQ